MSAGRTALVVLSALILQVSLFARFSYDGARPDVMLLVAVIGIPAIIYAVHVYYQPLDVLVGKVAAKIGINM